MVMQVTLELGPLDVWKPLSTKQASDRPDEACMLRARRAYGLWISQLDLHLRSLWLAETSKRLGMAAISPARSERRATTAPWPNIAPKMEMEGFAVLRGEVAEC